MLDRMKTTILVVGTLALLLGACGTVEKPKTAEAKNNCLIIPDGMELKKSYPERPIDPMENSEDQFHSPNEISPEAKLFETPDGSKMVLKICNGKGELQISKFLPSKKVAVKSVGLLRGIRIVTYPTSASQKAENPEVRGFADHRGVANFTIFNGKISSFSQDKEMPTYRAR